MCPSQRAGGWPGHNYCNYCYKCQKRDVIWNKTWFSTKCNFLFTLILHNHIGSPLHVYTHTHTHFYVHTISFIFPDTQFLNLHFSILIDTSAYIIKILLREVFSQNCERTCLDIKLLLKVLSIYPLLLASSLLVHENLVQWLPPPLESLPGCSSPRQREVFILCLSEYMYFSLCCKWVTTRKTPSPAFCLCLWVPYTWLFFFF